MTLVIIFDNPWVSSERQRERGRGGGGTKEQRNKEKRTKTVRSNSKETEKGLLPTTHRTGRRCL